MEAWPREIRLAFRSLIRHRGYAVLAVVILALGIAANTVVFSLVYGSLLRPPPFPDADRLMVIYRTAEEAGGRGPALTRWSFARFTRLRVANRSFAPVTAFGQSDFNLSGGDGEPERVPAEIVSAGYVATLGVPALLGRGFLPEEDSTPGSHPVALVSHGLWVRRFGRDAGIVGRQIQVNGEGLTVVGVMPAGFQGLTGRADLWVPEMMAPRLSYADHLTTPQNFISVVGRLRPGVDLAAARAELGVLGGTIAAEFPDEVDVPTSWSATAVPLTLARVDPANRKSVLVLFGAVGFLLLLASANVAGLGLVRAAERRQEMVVRQALGASRGRVVGQLMMESALLSLAGGAIGAALAWLVGRVVGVGIPGAIAGPANQYGALGSFAAPRMDFVVLGFSVAVSIGAMLLSGLVPALAAGRTDPAAELRDRAGTGRSRGVSRAQSVLVAIEIALALVLSVGSGLLFTSLRRLEAVPLGIEARNVLTFRIQPSEVRYGPREAPALIDRVIDAVAAVPGVRSVTVDACAPLGSSCANSTLFVAGRPEPRPGQAPEVMRHYVAPDHFKTLGIPLVRGRSFDPDDRAGRPRVAIINETAARRFWPAANPIGQRIWFGGGSSFDRPDSSAEIIGIVGDVPYGSLERGMLPSFYTPYRQFTYAFRTVMARVDGDPLMLVPSVRRAVRGVDDLPIFDARTLDDRLGDSAASTRFNAVSMGTFALVALLLAAGGVYAVIAHSVNQRTRELGIRFALGATRNDVLSLVVRQGVSVALVGIVVGAVASLALARLIRGLLFEVEAADPVVFAGQIAVLLAVALLASYLPARRAAGVDPARVLRAD